MKTLVTTFKAILFNAEKEEESNIEFKIGSQLTYKHVSDFVGDPIFLDPDKETAQSVFPGFKHPIIVFNKGALSGSTDFPVNVPFTAFIGETYRGNIVVIERVLLPLKIPIHK